MEVDENAEPIAEVPPDLTIREMSTLLDLCAAAHTSWQQMALDLQQRSGLPLMREPGQGPSVVGAALDAVYYQVTFDKDGSRRVALRPKHEAADTTWPVLVEAASPEQLSTWVGLADLVRDAGVRARLRHLLFQAGVGHRRTQALATVEDYLTAARDGWSASDSLTFAYTALRVATAVGDHDRAQTAALAVKDVVERSLREDKPGIAGRGLELLARVTRLPFDRDALLEEVLPTLGPTLTDRVLAAMIDNAEPATREALWRRRVGVLAGDAEATDDSLVQTSKFAHALRVAERAGIADLRRDVASRLQKAGQRPANMMKLSMLTRWDADELEGAARELIGDDGIGAGLLRWARQGPFTGDAERNRRVTEESLADSIVWAMMPRMVLDENHLPRFTGTTAEERFDLEVISNESRHIAMLQPIVALALELLGDRYDLPNRASLYGYFKTWPGFDDATAYMAASAVLRFWSRDYDGSFYIATPLLERTFRHLIVTADEGIYRMQRDQKPGQYPGLGALLDPLARLYDVDESWKRYYYVAVVHPTGLNLRNYAAHGLMGVIHRDVASLMLHLLLHLGTLQRRTPDLERSELERPVKE